MVIDLKKTRRKAAAAVCTAALALSLAGCTGDTLMNRVSGSDEMVVQSSVTMDESNVNALTAGQIQSVMVQEGDTVQQGQVLAVLNSDTLSAEKLAAQANVEKAKAAILQQQSAKTQAQAVVAQAQATLSSAQKGANSQQRAQLRLAVNAAQASLTTAQSAYTTAQNTYARVQAMYSAGGASKADLDNAQYALTGAKSTYSSAGYNLQIAQSKLADAEDGAEPEDIRKAQAAVAQAQASVQTADSAIQQAQATLKAAQATVQELQTGINKCTLKSPSAGVVTTVNVKNGDVVSAGLPTVVVTHIREPYILCNVKETLLGKIRNGQKVTIRLSATGDKTYTGKVTRINKDADFATKKASTDSDFDILTYGVKVVFDEQPKDLQDVLHAGMTAFVDFGK